MAIGDHRVDKEFQKLTEFGDHTAIKVISIMNMALCEERVENDVNGVVLYQGWAVIGSSESEAVWLISKLNYDGNDYFSERVWADGEDTFSKVWDNRASYNYSY